MLAHGLHSGLGAQHLKRQASPLVRRTQENDRVNSFRDATYLQQFPATHEIRPTKGLRGHSTSQT
jgi:hypothetical protein